MGKLPEAVATYDEVVNRLSRPHDPKLKLEELEAKALNRKGYALAIMGDMGQAKVCFDELLQRHGQSREPAVQDIVAKGVCWRGYAELETDGRETAMQSFQEAVKRGQTARAG